ncbi:hypothetical protein MYCTH_2298367 [Thermothelomyces thermophilus ATCC 42464]|uniref:Uncharacterized protein n=1 Tax=Thermothelomyces thermophilus (strain ATCC 42464 / BCRC 31852 / DSM 1799) TaxID=573729 RepID=G2Q1N2_THET4|nr:uncharacterized protein MYCTH_2298367 [Thermothelomyces thermophilus ATCC 42464]AEO55023.1 hypothetical protein MYCTH_2298367 [Thermothelomyces thermophilus ATCC 42464]
MAFSDETTVRKLRTFAEMRNCGSDVDFLLKVDEYSRALRDLTSSMSYISANFTGLTATTPLELSSEVAGTLKADIKYCVRSALPALEKLYQEAKLAAEERLSHTLYPEFVKYQLARPLTTSLLANRSPTGEMETLYPGLGDAFCLTDPLRPNNPVIFASDGLLNMAGYHRRQLVGENCRLFQGIATDPEAAGRLGEAVESGRETTELVLNYRLDGTPYWNLLYICPLMRNGSVRYFFGAQVCVSENMGSDKKDILGVLNFGRPSDEPADPVTEWPTSISWPARRSSDAFEPNQEDDKQSDKPISRRQRFFRRFYRKTPRSRASSNSRHSTASDQAPPDNDSPQPASPSPRLYPSPASQRAESSHAHHYHQVAQPLDEHSSPYSRFLVMRYPQETGIRSTRRQHAWPDRNSARHQTDPAAAVPDHLPISFCSSHALSFLGIRPQLAARTTHEPTASLLDRDVFSVLSSHLRSPTARNRAFKANVLAQLARGESVTAELMVPAPVPLITTSAVEGSSFSSSASYSAGAGSAGEGIGAAAAAAAAAAAGGGGGGGGSKRGSKSGKGVKTTVAGNGASYSSANPAVPPPASPQHADGPSSSSESWPRLSGTLDRGAEFLNHVLFSGGGGKTTTVLRRVVSRWVPLKDEDGRIGWVVLVLVPADGGGL